MRHARHAIARAHASAWQRVRAVPAAVRRAARVLWQRLRATTVRRTGGSRRRSAFDNGLRRVRDWIRVPTVLRDLRQGPGRRRGQTAPGGCALCRAARRAAGGLRGGLGRLWGGAGERLAPTLRRLGIGREPTVSRGRDIAAVLAAGDQPGSRRRHYHVHLPPGCNGLVELPLVMVLHGCHQTHEDMRAITRFDALADRAGFIVVYPYVTSWAGMRHPQCWGWWRRDEVTPGHGEVADLGRIIDEVRARYPVDARRIHIVGLSSGAGMAVAAMVCHADRVAAGVAVAGVAYGETPGVLRHPDAGDRPRRAPGRLVAAMRQALGRDRSAPPLLVVHSHDDPVVGIQAARRLRDTWAVCGDVELQHRGRERSGSTQGVPWTRTRYRARNGRAALETLFLKGVGHGWYGGAPGRFSFPEAPDVSGLAWQFLRKYALPV